MSQLKPTDELINTLSRAKRKQDLDDYLTDLSDDSRAFADYYFSLPAVSEIPLHTLIAASGIERTYFYQIKSGRRRPGQGKVLALCFAAGLPLSETQRLLKLAGAGALYARNRRDAIIIYAIRNGYTLQAANELLDDYGEALIK